MSGSVAFEFGRSSAKRKLAVHEKDDDFQVEYLNEVDHKAFNEQANPQEIKPIPLQPDTSAYFKKHKPSRYLPTSFENQVSNQEKFEKPVLDEQYNQKGDKKDDKLSGYGLQIRRPKNTSYVNGTSEEKVVKQDFNRNGEDFARQKFQNNHESSQLEVTDKNNSSNGRVENFKSFDPYSNFTNQQQNPQMLDQIIEEKLRDDLRDLPAAPDEENYQNVAVEDFGRAMLMGMGWNPNKEKNQNQVLVPDKRPDRLGLGAKAEDLQKKLDQKQKRDEQSSKVVNKEKTQKDQNVKQSPESKEEKHTNKSNKRDDIQNSMTTTKAKSNNIESNSNNNQFPPKHRKSSPPQDTIQLQDKQNLPNWLYNGIRVKIIDKKNYVKYFLSKGVVSDVFEAGVCDVHLESNGQIIQNIKQQNLETVVPRSKGAKVLVVRGQFKGQMGEFLKRDDSQQIVAVMLDDIMQVLKFGYDDVAEFVG